MQHEQEHYVDGAWVSPLEPKLVDVVDPSTEETFSKIAVGGARLWCTDGLSRLGLIRRRSDGLQTGPNRDVQTEAAPPASRSASALQSD